MAASIRSSAELGQVSQQGKLDLLLIGDVTVCFLVGAVQKYFSNTAHVTITIGDVKKVAALVNGCAFDMVFLKVTSALTLEELEAIKSIRFGKKKNARLLFVFIVPENFKGYGADVTFTEPLTMEKMNVVVKYWETYFINTGRHGEHGLFLQSPHGEHPGHLSTGLLTRSESLRNNTGLQLKVPSPDNGKRKCIPYHHSSKEKLRRERIKYSCEQLRGLLPYVKGRKNDVASVLEATVDYMKYVREQISPSILDQIARILQSNRRFLKGQAPIELGFPVAAMAQRESGVLAATYSPGIGVQFLDNQFLNVCPTPTARESLEEAVREAILGIFTAHVQNSH